jgi:hypothetical protein
MVPVERAERLLNVSLFSGAAKLELTGRWRACHPAAPAATGHHRRKPECRYQCAVAAKPCHFGILS